MLDQGSDITTGAYAALFDLVEESVVAFDSHGALIQINPAAASLLGLAQHAAVGLDVKDFFYTVDLCRPQSGIFPFDTNGSLVPCMAKTIDGSFLLVQVKCRRVGLEGPYLLVAYRDVQHEARRERERLASEITHLNERLYGTLAIISGASLGESSFEVSANRVSNELQRVMSADAAVFYLADEYGFTPYGISDGFELLGIEKAYLPMGVGVPTLVTRNRRTTRLQLVSPPATPDSGAIMLDLDIDARFRLRSMLAECCSTIVGTPVFSNGRVVAVVLIGWLTPQVVSSDDVQLLDTVADFLSVEFAAAVSQLEQKRNAGLTAAMNEIRELVRSEGEMTMRLAARIAGKVGSVVPSRILIMETNAYSNTTLVRLRDSVNPHEIETLEFPYGMSEVFADGGFVEIAPHSPCGMWIGRHTDLSHGFGVLLTSGEAADRPQRMALLIMRGPLDHPFDATEQGFLRTLSREVGSTLHAEQTRAHDAEIAKALQVGLRNELAAAPGVTTASLYISATESAVVGGDFFDLYDLHGDRVIVLMGDVSGKGVESAAMASLVKTALAAYAWNYLDPASMVASLNNLFLNFSRLETFASLVVVAIDFSTMRATYCSAGHPPAMLVHNPEEPGAELELLTVQSPIVGAFEGLSYTNGTFDFKPGDLLYLYTDGTTEARNAKGDFFGEDALRETLLRACRSGIEGLPERVLDGVHAFAGGNLHDDIAMVALRFDGQGTSDARPAGQISSDAAPDLPYDDFETVIEDLFG